MLSFHFSRFCLSQSQGSRREREFCSLNLEFRDENEIFLSISQGSRRERDIFFHFSCFEMGLRDEIYLILTRIFEIEKSRHALHYSWASLLNQQTECLMWHNYMIFTPKPWSDKILNLLDIIVYVTDKNYILLDTHYFPYVFRLGKTRLHEFFQIYRPINTSSPPIWSAQGDIHGEIPQNRLLAITFDWSVLGTSG